MVSLVFSYVRIYGYKVIIIFCSVVRERWVHEFAAQFDVDGYLRKDNYGMVVGREDIPIVDALIYHLEVGFPHVANHLDDV